GVVYGTRGPHVPPSDAGVRPVTQVRLLAVRVPPPQPFARRGGVGRVPPPAGEPAVPVGAPGHEPGARGWRSTASRRWWRRRWRWWTGGVYYPPCAGTPGAGSRPGDTARGYAASRAGHPDPDTTSRGAAPGARTGRCRGSRQLTGQPARECRGYWSGGGRGHRGWHRRRDWAGRRARYRARRGRRRSGWARSAPQAPAGDHPRHRWAAQGTPRAGDPDHLLDRRDRQAHKGQLRTLDLRRQVRGQAQGNHAQLSLPPGARSQRPAGGRNLGLHHGHLVDPPPVPLSPSSRPSMQGLFTRKSVADCENDIAERGGLRRSLTKWHLTALGVGATIGAGIFA